MKRLGIILVSILGFNYLNIVAAQSLWNPINPTFLPTKVQWMHPSKFQAFQLDEINFRNQFINVSTNPKESIFIELPLPNGNFKIFKVWETPIMPQELANKYPEISTYTGQAVNNASVTVKLDFTVYGFHAMIYDGEETAFIDPFDLYHDGLYMVHYMHDEIRQPNEVTHCYTKHKNIVTNTFGNYENMVQKPVLKPTSGVLIGHQLRTYRLALCGDSYYCQAATGIANPTIPACLSVMTTAMNRVNGVYERELSATMVFVAHEDTLIWPTATGSVNGPDRFYAIDANGVACMMHNKTICDSLIGKFNYDIGHVFTTGAGGVTGNVGCLCDSTYKAQSATGQPTPVGDGFTINYVAHEMGHQFGSDHTFNDDTIGSCGGNAVQQFAYEPGSGTTIMCYAGICPPDDLQQNSDPYFGASSILQMITYLNGEGDGCAVKTPTLNLGAGIDSFSHNYSIPFLTPFELIAPNATDSTLDSSLTYCWEQMNLGDFGTSFVNTHNFGPLFRFYSPTYSTTRVFPKIQNVVAGILNDGGYENMQGEKVPDVARYLTFKLSLRDIYQGNGCFLIPSDTIHIDAINTGTGFTVSSQSTTGISFLGGSSQTITWNVANSPAPPINTQYVNIYMSVDGGINWIYNLGQFENNGSATVIIPNPASATNHARFKIKGHNNIFFNVNTNDFTVITDGSKPISAMVNNNSNSEKKLELYPNPAKSILNVTTDANSPLNAVIYSALGKIVWQGQVNGLATISIGSFAKGMYYFVASDIQDQHFARKFVIE